MPKKYSSDESAGPLRVEVQADRDESWSSNGVRYDVTEVEEAVEYAKDLASRWTLVKAWRVVHGGGEEVVATSHERGLF